MDTAGSQTLTKARIVALALIGLTVVGLVYLRLSATDETVSVPPGAETGDLTLEPCQYVTEEGVSEAECGTLVVAETQGDPNSRLIALPVTRILARSDDPGEPIFRLEGGPGMTNMNFPLASRYTENHDLVLVGYRGVDGSVRLDCPEVVSALQHSTDFLAAESMEAYGRGLRSCAERLTREGVDVASYGLVQQVDDMETARVAFGYDRINLLSESAGTRTATIYPWRYPESIHRSVMFGVNPPGNFFWDGESTDEQLSRYAVLCAEDAACRERTDDLAASMRMTSDEIPDRWLFLPVKQGNVRVGTFFALMQSTAEPGPLSAPGAFDAWLAAAEGDASAFWLLSVVGDLMYPKLFVWGQYASAAHLDADAASQYFSSGGQEVAGNLGRAASAYAWGGGLLSDAWPEVREEGQYTRVRESEVETLIISGELDTSTPPQVASKELLPYLPNGHEVVLPGFVHSPSFWSDQPEANTRLINTYFDNGTVDDSLYEAQPINFSPGVTLTNLGKMVFAILSGLAAITIVTLLGMARRVQTRGRIGPKSAALLRSVYPLVLGLGGWSFGTLIVFATMPAVRIDNALLIILSVSVPVGLGIYLAWVHRDWSVRSKAAGLTAALGGALVGASLGFYVTEGFMALLTAILGAITGTNLILIGLDIFRTRSARPFAVPSPSIEEVEHVRT